MFLAGATGFTSIAKPVKDTHESFSWNKIAKQYPDSRSKLLNLNTGSAGVMPKIVEEQFLNFVSALNRSAPYEKAAIWKELELRAKQELAEMVGADADELALVRNTTEGLNYILTGINIPKNVDVVASHCDYTLALDTLKKLAKEKSFNLKMIDLELPLNREEILAAYKKKITDSTELVLITAMTHREGQIMPVSEISQIAKEHGAKVLVDAAHAIGHFEHSVKNWNCDFYCASLHKWLGGPLGTGMLYVKRDRIVEVRGSYNANQNLLDKMEKFESVGTKSFALNAAVLSAVYFHQSIGTKKKHNRLMDLTDYWTTSIKGFPNIKVYKPEEYGGITSFHLPGSSSDILSFFQSKNIHFKKVRAPKAKQTNYRISPNIYHRYKDLDRFIGAMQEYTFGL